MEKLEFRPVTEAEHALATEFKRLTAIDAMGSAELFDTWFTPERPYAALIRESQAHDPASCALAWKDEVAVGHVHVFIRKDGRGFLNNVYLLPEWRGQGLGEQLDAYAMDFFRRHGVTKALLRTNPEQVKLVGFYQRVGWRLGEMSDHGLVWMEREIEG